MGKPWKRFTPDEDVKLEAMRIEGKSNNEIGAALGRIKSSVYHRLCYLAEKAEADLDEGSLTA